MENHKRKRKTKKTKIINYLIVRQKIEIQMCYKIKEMKKKTILHWHLRNRQYDHHTTILAKAITIGKTTLQYQVNERKSMNRNKYTGVVF